MNLPQEGGSGLLWNQTGIKKILHMVANDEIEIGRDHLRGQHITAGIQMPPQIIERTEAGIMNRGVAMKIDHIAAGKPVGHFVEQIGVGLPTGCMLRRILIGAGHG